MTAKKRGRPKKAKHIEELVTETIENKFGCAPLREDPVFELARYYESSKEVKALKEGIANLEKVNAYLSDRIKAFEKSTVESAMKYSYWERDATAKQELIDSYLEQVDTLKSDTRALESARSYWMGEAQKREEEIASLTKCLESITETVKQKDIDFEATIKAKDEIIYVWKSKALLLECEGTLARFCRKLFGGKNGSREEANS